MGTEDDRSASLDDLLREAIRAHALELHTALPGRIVAYDATTLRATVAPEIKRVTRDGEVIAIPDIEDVPVAFPAGGGYILNFPLAVGDRCLLVFAERDISGWKETGDALAPPESRRHAYSDAVAFVGLAPNGLAPSAGGSATAVQLRSGDSLRRLQIGANGISVTSDNVLVLSCDGNYSLNADGTANVTADGGIAFTVGTDELLAVLVTAIDLIATSTAGGSPLSNAAAIQTEKAKIVAMQS